MKVNLNKRIWLILKILIGLAVFLFVLGAGMGVFFQTDAGREWARKNLNTLLTSQVQGTFEVKHLDEIGLDRLVVRDLVAKGYNGETVLELNKVELNPVWSELLLRKIHGSSVTINGGVINLIQNDTSDSLSQVFRSPNKKKKRGEPIPILFENIQANNLEFNLKGKGLPTLSIKDLSAFLRLDVAHRRVVIRLDETNGHLDLPILGDTKLRKITGEIKSKVREVLDIDLSMELGKLVPTHITYLVPKNEGKPGDPKIIFRFSKKNSPDFFSKLVLKMADAFTDTMEVNFED